MPVKLAYTHPRVAVKKLAYRLAREDPVGQRRIRANGFFRRDNIIGKL
jgi:hypothetical protein